MVESGPVDDQLRGDLNHEDDEAQAVDGDEQTAGQFHGGGAGLQTEDRGIDDDDGGDRALEPSGFEDRLHPAQHAALHRRDPPERFVLIAAAVERRVH